MKGLIFFFFKEKKFSYREEKITVIAIAAASSIVFNEQFKTQKRKKWEIWVTPWPLERSTFRGSQQAFTCSKLTIKTLEQGVKYIQS